jgi:hypothetical protein
MYAQAPHWGVEACLITVVLLAEMSKDCTATVQMMYVMRMYAYALSLC